MEAVCLLKSLGYIDFAITELDHICFNELNRFRNEKEKTIGW